MTYESKYSIERSVVFRENFEGEQWTRRQGGTPTDVSYGSGIGTFNGTTSFTEIDPILSSLGQTTAGSFVCRVKPDDATPTGNRSIIAFGDTNGNEYLIFYIEGTTGKLTAEAVSGGYEWQIKTNAIAFSDNVWTDVALVQDGTAPVLYVDGVAVAQTITVSSDNTVWFADLNNLDNARIGCLSFNNNGNILFLDGDIDIVEIDKRALTADQAKNLYDKDTYRALPAQQKQQLGVELHTNANAASDPNGNEADATTGFTSIGLDGTGNNVFESQSSVVNTGSYAIEANANDTPTGAARFYVDLNAAPFNAVNGKRYKISFDSRHVGTGGGWVASLAAASNQLQNTFLTKTSVDTSYETIIYEWTHTLDHRYFNFRENNGSNDGGVFFDNFSVKEILVEETQEVMSIDNTRGVIGDKYAGNAVGSELHTNANAASDPNGNEADATTGFANTGLAGIGANIFESQSSIVSEGSYAIKADANDTPIGAARFYVDLDSAPFSLIVGRKYRVSFRSRHVGVGGDWTSTLSDATSLGTNLTIIRAVTNGDTTWSEYSQEFTHSVNTRYCGYREANASNDGGVYFDNLSIKEIRTEPVNTAVTVKKDGSYYAMDFDGSTSLLNIDSVLPDLASTTTGTWMCWVKPFDGTPSAIEALCSFGDTNAVEILYSRINTDGTFTALATKASTIQWKLDTDSSVFSDKIWTHIALVQDGTEPVLYVNKEAVAQTFSNSTDKTAWFSDLTGLDNGRIGCFDFNSGGDSNFFKGQISQPIIYDGILTSEEITQAYTSTKHLYNL